MGRQAERQTDRLMYIVMYRVIFAAKNSSTGLMIYTIRYDPNPVRHFHKSFDIHTTLQTIPRLHLWTAQSRVNLLEGYKQIVAELSQYQPILGLPFCNCKVVTLV